MIVLKWARGRKSDSDFVSLNKFVEHIFDIVFSFTD